MNEPKPAAAPSPRRRRLGLAAALLLIVAIGLLLFVRPAGFATKFARVRVGQTKAEILTLLGPTGDFVTANAEGVGFAIVGPIFQGPASLRRVDAWRTDEGDFYVGYDGQEIAVAVRANPCRRRRLPWSWLTAWVEGLFARPLKTAPAFLPSMPLPKPASSR